MKILNSTNHITNNFDQSKKLQRNSFLRQLYVVLHRTIILLALTPFFAEASDCDSSTPTAVMYGNFPQCTGNEIGQLCEIRFTELVKNVPANLREKLDQNNVPGNLREKPGRLDNEPFGVDRVVVVWPGNGTLPNPPAMIFNDGYTSTINSAATNSSLDFQAHWPEAIIIYTEGSRLVCYDHWNLHAVDQVPFFSPRFPYYLTQAEKTPYTDFRYIDILTEKVLELFPYDENRLYAAGHSSGGFFTFSLMKYRRDMFRAFAVLGAYADFGDRYFSDNASIVANGQVPSPRPVLYMMGLCENVFGWTSPNCDLSTLDSTTPLVTANNLVHHTLRQLTAKNGTDIPNQGNIIYLQNHILSVVADPTNVKTLTFPPFTPYGAEVQFKLYIGDHSWPPRDASPALKASKWVVDFFKSHSEPLVRRTPVNWGWQIPVLSTPTIY